MKAWTAWRWFLVFEGGHMQKLKEAVMVVAFMLILRRFGGVGVLVVIVAFWWFVHFASDSIFGDCFWFCFKYIMDIKK